MGWVVAFNTVLLILIMIGLWMKLAAGDMSDACCAWILLVGTVCLMVLGALVWGAGLLFDWWGAPW
jgi:hypothetical protein